MALSVSSKVHKGSFQRLSSRRHTRSAFPTLSPLGRGHAGGLIYPSAGRSDRKSGPGPSLGSSAVICRFSPLLLYYTITFTYECTNLIIWNQTQVLPIRHLISIRPRLQAREHWHQSQLQSSTTLRTQIPALHRK